MTRVIPLSVGGLGMESSQNNYDKFALRFTCALPASQLPKNDPHTYPAFAYLFAHERCEAVWSNTWCLIEEEAVTKISNSI